MGKIGGPSMDAAEASGDRFWTVAIPRWPLTALPAQGFRGNRVAALSPRWRDQWHIGAEALGLRW